jgi:hypothetical protein
VRRGLRVLHDRQGGLVRQVSSAEIVAQVALARTLRPVKKVVFMGMGEPAHNLDNVLEAIDLLGTAGNIGHKNLVFSTVGDPRVFERLPRGASSRRWRCRCTPRAPTCAATIAAARTAHDARRTGGSGRALRPCHGLPHPVPVDAAGRHQRRPTNWPASCGCSRASTR